MVEQLTLKLYFCESEKRFMIENGMELCQICHQAIRDEIHRISSAGIVQEAFTSEINPVFVEKYIQLENELINLRNREKILQAKIIAECMSTGGGDNADIST
jgi:hypothetical protein